MYRIVISLTFLVGSCVLTSLASARTVSAPDSVGVEVVDGKQVIIHLLKPKETYYGLSRKYGVLVPDLINANNNKPLKIGETVRIPTDRPARAREVSTEQPLQPIVQAEEAQEQAEAPRVELQPGEYTTYIVGRGETLYAVSKRFRIPIESIKRANGLSSDDIQEGLHLRVPKQPLPEDPPVMAETPVLRAAGIIDTSAAARERAAEFELRKNRYGIREMNEKGVGVWIDDLSQDGATMLALHKNVPIGTIVKVTNPMTNHSTFVKVVGKFVDTAETQGAIIVISRSVATVIGILDRRFQVEIAYGAPVESSR